MDRKLLVDAIVEAIRIAETRLPLDVYEAIRSAAERSEGAAKAQLQAVLRNIEVAAREGRPICQDTGLLTFYVWYPSGFPMGMREVEEAIIEAVRRATREVPLRPNAVHPVTGRNSGDNTGLHVPVIHWLPAKSERLEIVVVPKGGGSEYPARLYMVPPAKGLEAALEKVIDAVVEAGGLPCPPTIVGVGIGGTVEETMFLAKYAATVREVGSRNSDPRIARLEEMLVEELNKLEIGPMGLGGYPTVLDVHIEVAHRHPATYPVAVAFNCWAARRARLVVEPSGEWRIASRHYTP
ncbi:hydro-lyase, Fe-S type, tartrate/fumarate subfamily, alpha subunit [Pyrolobus fumarii 1A]|uniref:Hydro-lyase, Fe-S type, tartrate/fumarate subfamily, alpha subunit n=1 Tax=Pyrolobus fumarii (strain DSM 11204 / 1A) TaxID=694429 RepID=G0EGB0_PYRF1|nr:fumarate hydratase [Pyrolobus fumarii]AEM39135.1 hydro-lyase, Fe-S type, tartrate/fumarate subfamily, alpha subunit [Pyrolobus fumarii 1A]